MTLGVRQNNPTTPCPIPGCNCNGGVPMAHMADEAELRARYPSMFARKDHMHENMPMLTSIESTENPLVDHLHLAVVRARADEKRSEAQQTVSMVDEISRLRDVCHDHWDRAEAQNRRADIANVATESQVAVNNSLRLERDQLVQKLARAIEESATHRVGAEILAKKLSAKRRGK